MTRLALAVWMLGVLGVACSARGSLDPCTADDDCPDLEGCDYESIAAGDGYCTPLCSSDGECPGQLLCGTRGTEAASCDEKGEHRELNGICDQFDGLEGPNTCDVD